MDKSLNNISLNDETDYGFCFACGHRNPSSLHLEFRRIGSQITTSFLGNEKHQGFPGYLHGGILSTILDETLSKVSVADNKWTMTAQLNIRFRRPVKIGQLITANAHKVRIRGKFLEAKGSVHLPDNSIAAEATGKYAFLKNDSLTYMNKEYPLLSRERMET